MIACAETLTAESEGKEPRARRALGVENCGYRYDAETENYYVRNRYYSPAFGRWLTRDLIGYRGGINPYGYVNSSPVGNVDAWGGDVYVFDNLNAHGGLILHQNIAVDTPSGGRYAVSYGLVPGTGWISGEGEVYVDNGEYHWWTSEELHVSPLYGPAFDAIAERYLESLVGRKGHYNAFTDNCRDFSQKEFNKIKQMYNKFQKSEAAGTPVQDIYNMQNPAAVPSGASPLTS